MLWDLWVIISSRSRQCCVYSPLAVVTHLKEEGALNATQTGLLSSNVCMSVFNGTHVFLTFLEAGKSTAGSRKRPLSAGKQIKQKIRTRPLTLDSPCLCHPQHRTACHPRPESLRPRAPACGPGPSSWAPERRSNMNRFVQRRCGTKMYSSISKVVQDVSIVSSQLISSACGADNDLVSRRSVALTCNYELT